MNAQPVLKNMQMRGSLSDLALMLIFTTQASILPCVHVKTKQPLAAQVCCGLWINWLLSVSTH